MRRSSAGSGAGPPRAPRAPASPGASWRSCASWAAGRTNREIAQELFLSHRTVDMHVRNLLRKLGSRSRAEVVGRAGELGLLGQ